MESDKKKSESFALYNWSNQCLCLNFSFLYSSILLWLIVMWEMKEAIFYTTTGFMVLWWPIKHYKTLSDLLKQSLRRTVSKKIQGWGEGGIQELWTQFDIFGRGTFFFPNINHPTGLSLPWARCSGTFIFHLSFVITKYIWASQCI